MTTTTVHHPAITNGVTPHPPRHNLPAVDWEWVTPEQAEFWLAKNVKNRNLREAKAAAYGDDMASDDWRVTGETIKFDRNGNLSDGQHRLRGQIISGRTMWHLVVRGIEPEAQEDIDRGIPRKFHDVLSLRGETNCSNLASIVRRVHGWNQGVRRNLDTGNNGATVAALLRTLDAHPELRDITRRAGHTASGCDLPASLVGLAMWVFDRIDQDDCEFFFGRLVDGQGLAKGDAIYELRRTLQGTKDVRGERSQTFLLAITIKAWNAYRNGDTVGLYRWRPGGAKPEQFPEPV